MNKIKTVIKYELFRYFYSPLAYVYLVSFLFLSGSLAIYAGHVFMNGEANLWGLFDYQPWVYLLFIPGVAMRSWSEEFRSKSIIQILTVPISVSELVWGKFFASWIFAATAILLTFPFWITINILGSPDNAVIIISYLGCIILAGAMLAISQTLSALTKSPVIAMVSAVFVNLLFFWSGFEYVLFWARKLFSDVIVDTIISFSFLNHFVSFSRGIIELRDLVFFGSLIVFFNLLTIIIVSLKTKGSSGLISSSSPLHSFIVIILLFIGFFGLNIIANNVLRQINFDFTEEKYLSLTKNTKDVLRKLERPVTAKLYYSPILEKRNPEMRQIFDRIKHMLKQYKSYGNGKFDYRIYNPTFLGKIEDKALADGIQPIPLIDINQNALFGISFTDSLTNKAVIPFFSLERFPYLEQDLTTSIYKLQHKKKTLGLLSSLPLTGNVRLGDVMIAKWEIINQISDLYNIVPIQKPEDLDQTYDVLMIVHPYNLDNDTIERIKKHKKILLLMDVADNASRIYSPENGSYVSSNLSTLADYWGIDFYGDTVIADFNNSITVDETVNYKKNPSFTQDLLQFIAKRNEFNPNHRITHKLDSILFSSASMVMPLQNKDVLFFPLITTSGKSALMSADFAKKNKTPREVLDNFTPQNEMLITAAEFLSNNPSQPFDIIAVGDTDFIYDTFWAKEKRFLDSSYYIPLFDSANFIMNALDHLTENDDLISLRGKRVHKRPLYIIENMRKNNVYRYKLKENDIFNAINGAKKALAEVIAKKNFEERETFSSDELAIIGSIRKEINTLRLQLSDLRINANNDIVSLEVKVKFFNVYFISLIITLLAVILCLRHKKFHLSSGRHIFIGDGKTPKLFMTVLVISLLAGLSVYMDNKNTISEYEDVKVFKDFENKLNDIQEITLKNSSQTLTFVRHNGIWTLQEYPDLPVYQERIRSFLVALSNMVFYEKKSDKVEDLPLFGFLPLKNKNSQTIEVTLGGKDNQTIEKFDIGQYDMELGRGSKAAYIKLNNQFQVWLVDVDFYDLSLVPQNWTYSTLWNLRFGRFIKYNNVTDDKKIMILVKNLLNTMILASTDNIEGKQIAVLDIYSENDNHIKLSFYETSENKYYVTYDFVKSPQGKHLEFFASYIKGKYLEISQDSWKELKNDIIGTK